MKFSEFMRTVDREFHARLFLKTGWGCHQVWKAWLEAKSAARAQDCPEFTVDEFVMESATREHHYQLQEQVIEEFADELKKETQNQYQQS